AGDMATGPAEPVGMPEAAAPSPRAPSRPADFDAPTQRLAPPVVSPAPERAVLQRRAPTDPTDVPVHGAHETTGGPSSPAHRPDSPPPPTSPRRSRRGTTAPVPSA